MPPKVPLSFSHTKQYNFRSHYLSGKEMGLYFRIAVIIGVP